MKPQRIPSRRLMTSSMSIPSTSLEMPCKLPLHPPMTLRDLSLLSSTSISIIWEQTPLGLKLNSISVNLPIVIYLHLYHAAVSFASGHIPSGTRIVCNEGVRTLLGLKKLVSLLIMTMSLYIFSASPGYTLLRDSREERVENGRMKNVSAWYENGQALLPESPGQTVKATQNNSPLPALEAAFKADTVSNTAAPAQDSALISLEQARLRDEKIRETTIQGGLSVKNMTGYQLDMGKLLLTPPDIKMPADDMQILVIHTHASEAYTPAGLDTYEASDESRTEDTKYNIVRVGDELCAILEEAGLKVIHDRNIYDYPSYTGSYTRSGDAVQSWLAEYPGIKIVIDVHRDALGENGVVYKTMAEEQGVVASQIMLLVGTDESGLEHPGWQQNLSLALYLQRVVSAAHPTLMRPVELVPQRYNQHLSPGSIIMEVGSNGNTLQEALAAARLFARSAAPALTALVQGQ